MPVRKELPPACKGVDRRCLAVFDREHRDGLISEFRCWRQNGAAAALHDTEPAVHAMKSARDAGPYRQEQWASADQLGADGIVAGEPRGIAVVQVTFFLPAISEGVGDFQADR